MSYRLGFDQAVGQALRATAVQRLDHAANALRDDDGDPVAAVHTARKDLKKTRSLLRLARPGMATHVYREENSALREAGRAMSAARDADVLVATLDDLGRQLVGRAPEPSLTALRDALATRAKDSRGPAGAGASADVIDALAAACARVERWPLDDADDRTVLAGARLAYQRGREALRVAERDPSDEHLHDWRKRVKDLWYHQRLLRDAWPTVLNAHAEASSELADLLGDDHDLAVLQDAVADHHATHTADPAAELGIEPVLDLIAHRRAGLQHQAFRLGRRVYAEPPKRYGRRVAGYVRARRDERSSVALS